MHFLLRSYVHFWNQYKKTNFLCPIRPIQRKNFSSLIWNNEPFWEIKSHKWEKRSETAQYFEKRFFINRSLIFIALPKFYATHRNYVICQNHWSLLARLHRPAGQYGNLIPNWFLAPIVCSQIPVLDKSIHARNQFYGGINSSWKMSRNRLPV